MISLAILGLTTADAQAIASRLRGVALTASLDDCDAAVVLRSTATSVERLLRAGKDVLITLDAGLAHDQLQQLADTASRARARFVVANSERYAPSRQLIRQQLDTSKLGEPGLVRLHHWGKDASLLGDLDLVLWYFGVSPSHVQAVRNETVTQLHLGFPGGGMALLSQTRLAGDYRYLSIIGSCGAAYADDHPNMQLLLRDGEPRALHTNDTLLAWTAMTREFLERKPESYPRWRELFAVAGQLDLP